MRRFPAQEYRFDRMFMLHLASRLRAHYDPLVRDLLPAHFWDVLLKLALLEALLAKRDVEPSPSNHDRWNEGTGGGLPLQASSTTQRPPRTPTIGRLS